jgi:UPF0716 protein FxsA
VVCYDRGLRLEVSDPTAELRGIDRPVLGRLLLLFIVVPLVELTLLLVLADLTDWWVSLLLVLITGMLGTVLARTQGFRTYRRIQSELSSGQMPTESLLDALCIFLAGALLLTPGMLTDLLGLSLLIPPCRAWYRRMAAHWIRTRFRVQMVMPGRSSELDGHWEPRADGAAPPDPAKVIDSYVVPRDEPESKSPDS